MSLYQLNFLPTALKEWKKLNSTIQDAFKKKLAERLKHPHVPSAKLTGHKDCYKIKLRDIGYRLVYEVIEQELTVLVIVVGKRDKNQVYKLFDKRLSAKTRVQ